MSRHGKQGFTLIELLVVIAIVALLSSVVLASLNTAREHARDARRLADARQIQHALELYANDNGGVYPFVPATPAHTSDLASALVPDYIPAIPVDPSRTDTSYGYRYFAHPSPYTTYTILLDLEEDGDDNWCKINHGVGYSGWQQFPDCS